MGREKGQKEGALKPQHRVPTLSSLHLAEVMTYIIYTLYSVQTQWRSTQRSEPVSSPLGSIRLYDHIFSILILNHMDQVEQGQGWPSGWVMSLTMTETMEMDPFKHGLLLC